MDYTIKNGLGIRLQGQRTCQVIRLQHGEWKEIGPVYTIPVAQVDIEWTETGIPHSVLSVALRAYELDHPDTKLREVLTRTKKLAEKPLFRSTSPSGRYVFP
jgi:hypothetical protein